MAYYEGSIQSMSGDATAANAPTFTPEAGDDASATVSVSAAENAGLDSVWIYAFTNSDTTLTVSQTGLRQEFLTSDAGALVESGSEIFGVLKN